MKNIGKPTTEETVIVSKKRSNSWIIWVVLIIAGMFVLPSIIEKSYVDSAGESINTSQVISYGLNQDVSNEFNLRIDQYNKLVKSNQIAVDNFNYAADEYNAYLDEYYEMSYYQQQSSSAVNKMNTLKTNFRSAARSSIISNEVLESQTDDLLMFMEVNKKVLMDMDSKHFLELRSTLIETKTICKSSKEVANETLYN